MSKNEFVSVSVSMDTELCEKITKQAIEEGRTRSNLIQYIVRKYLLEHGGERNG